MSEIDINCSYYKDAIKKEIIIDGIDVSECCFYNNGKCNNPNGMACNCINNAVCYFKELKRLQEENEELKARLQTLDDEVLTVEITLDEFERYKKYKQALEEIENKLTDLYCNLKK